MTPEQVKEFQKAIGVAEWKLDLWRFAEALGSDADHDYIKEKFRALQDLNRALSKFDAATLARVINVAEEQPPVKVVDHLDGNPHNNSLENLKVRNQQGAVKLGVLFTVFVLVGCLLAVGYACGRKASCETPTSSVTKLAR